VTEIFHRPDETRAIRSRWVNAGDLFHAFATYLSGEEGKRFGWLAERQAADVVLQLADN
jgi:hypothetical protein